MKIFRTMLWALVAVAAVGLAVLIARGPPKRAEPAAIGETMARLGGPFTLTGSDGRPFSSHKLAGRPYAIFFGFTHCPDVCPTTLSRLAGLRRQLPGGDKAFDIVFVSVDPERDTPAEMKKYAALFDTPLIALTGSPAAIEQVKKQFGIFSEKVAQPGGDYTVDHSAAVLMFDKDGEFIGTIAPDEGKDAALAKLKRLAV